MRRQLNLLIFLFVSGVLSAQDFSSSVIPNAVFQRMESSSWPKNGQLDRANYRYLKVTYVDEKGKEKQGEIVCNKAVAKDLLQIFRELYAVRYPIHSIRLIDDFDGSDERSMRANNTSCFNYRKAFGLRRLSKHASGMAIDINPLWNPCIHRNGRIEPKNASPSHLITTSDACYKIFRAHGWRWGGRWRSKKDYQHFER